MIYLVESNYNIIIDKLGKCHQDFELQTYEVLSALRMRQQHRDDFTKFYFMGVCSYFENLCNNYIQVIVKALNFTLENKQLNELKGLLPNYEEIVSYQLKKAKVINNSNVKQIMDSFNTVLELSTIDYSAKEMQSFSKTDLKTKLLAFGIKIDLNQCQRVNEWDKIKNIRNKVAHGTYGNEMGLNEFRSYVLFLQEISDFIYNSLLLNIKKIS